MAAQLAPVPRPIGMFDQFIATKTETLVLKEHVLSLSGDSFDITLASGQPVLRVQGTVFSLSGRKNGYDMAGSHLFTIARELMHLHMTYVLLYPSGQKFFELRSRFQLLGSKATATFTSPATGKAESLTMSGNWFDTSASILDDSNGCTVARIDRKLCNGRQLLFGQQTYAVLVAPGVDLAVIAALCICLDEKDNEQK
ncbi:duf567 domain containing protein [Grosmannia clavigera kw1407]|uniref:Duf567 domain containing protein n=1 Tax=Grosmannia clavigera (strain kw1407 / UAMH 11150) TaxID=655863 RepID=F0XNT3_GROCL|nr:duf567 domain containing protein [Grosmannia clavigera kw1407]EFX00203.1 duf567 domain containing protein [Grosmannia clavigera kw1407]